MDSAPPCPVSLVLLVNVLLLILSKVLKVAMAPPADSLTFPTLYID